MNIKVTATLFTAVKTLLEAGATYSEVNKYYGVSAKTCQNIKAAENYDEYKAIITAIVAKQHEKRVEKKLEKKIEKQEVTPTPVIEHKTVTVPWSVMQEMQKTNELLALISNKLAYIVEQLS